MSPEVAIKLLPLVNNENFNLLEEYIKERIYICNNNIYSAKNMEAVFAIQGQVKELNFLSNLREEANLRSKEKIENARSN